MVALDGETSNLDPMQANLCGLSLAVAPNEACYVPLTHRQGGDGDRGLFQGEIAADQIAESRRLGGNQDALEDPGVIKVGQDTSPTGRFRAARIEIAPYDDTS